MKVCPKCNQTYNDNVSFCLNDGTGLIAPGNQSKIETAQFNNISANTPNQFPGASIPTIVNPNAGIQPKKSKGLWWVLGIFGVLILLCSGGGLVALVAFLPKYQTISQNNSSNSVVTTKNTNNGISNSSGQTNSTEPGSSGLTMEKYLRLDNNISYQEAENILGSKGAELSSSGSGKYKSASYKWGNDFYEYIILIFVNDKLISRSQAGLSKRISENLTLDKYNRLNTGMSYEQATAILGEGDEANKSVFGSFITTTYQWKIDNLTYVSAVFQNGKLYSKSQNGLK